MFKVCSRPRKIIFPGTEFEIWPLSLNWKKCYEHWTKFTVFYLLENQMQTFPTRKEPSLDEQGYVTISTTLQGSSKKKKSKCSDEERYLLVKYASVQKSQWTFRVYWLRFFILGKGCFSAHGEQKFYTWSKLKWS